MTRTQALGGSIALVLALATAAHAQPGARDPKFGDPEADARVAATLAQATTKEALTQLAGVKPIVCIAATPGGEICEWRLARRESGYASLARAIDSDVRIALLCDLPSDRSARSADSCSVYPRRSNRADWYIQRRLGHKRHLRGEKTDKRRRRYHQMATATLDAARTLSALSRLVGAAPDTCTSRGAQRDCVWKATSRTYGHGTLTVAAEVSKSKKVRLHCTLPANGSPRKENSCRVEVGA